MASNDLPSRENYVANHVTDIESCDICLMPFGDEHLPARLSGTNSCHHVFGSACIKDWLNSENYNANKCPTCRALLFSSNDSDDDDDDDDQDDQQHQAPPAVLDRPVQSDDVFTYNLHVFQTLDHERLAFIFVSFLVDRLDQPGTFNNDRIRACVSEALRDCANYHDTILIINDEAGWAEVITAVKVLIGEWMVTGGRPSYRRCLQIVTLELQWSFSNPNVDYGPEPLVSSHNFSGHAEVCPVITDRRDDFGTISIDYIHNYKTAHCFIQCILGSFAKGTAYNHWQIRTRIQVALIDTLRLSGVGVTIPDEYHWTCLIAMVSRMLVLWNATGLQPSPLWGIRQMAEDFQWNFDGLYVEEVLLAEAWFGKSHDGGRLIDHANGVCAAVSNTFNQQQNHGFNSQQRLDIRSITSYDNAIQLLQGLIYYLNRNTGALDTRINPAQIQRLVNMFLLDEFNVAVPETVWPGLIALVQELRRQLSMDKRNITAYMAWWMKEMKETARWRVGLTQEGIFARIPGCNGLFSCGNNRCGCSSGRAGKQTSLFGGGH